MPKEIVAVTLTDTHLKEENIEINLRIFEQAADKALALGQTVIYHLGDIFNSRKAQSQDVLNAFGRILDMLEEKGVTLILIPGNHDKVDYSSENSFLDTFKHYPALTLVTDYFAYPVNETLVFHFLPFFSDQVYREKLLDINNHIARKTGVRHILFTHIGITGAVMNNGMKVEGISASDFEIFDLVFVGHYHDFQSFSKFIYLGSSIQHNFGETQNKGMALIYDDLTYDILPLAFPLFTTVEVDVKKITTQEIDELEKYKRESGDNIRVILVGDAKDVKAFNRKLLLDIGIAVTTKEEEIKREEVDERIEPLSQKTILEEFDEFCQKNKLDKERGMTYLLKALNIHGSVTM